MSNYHTGISQMMVTSGGDSKESIPYDEYEARRKAKKDSEFHAKKQYADFVKAALTGISSKIIVQGINEIDTEGFYAEHRKILAREACALAEATLEEMIRRGRGK